MIDDAVKILKARITCLERETKGVCGYPSECDSCEYCYGQGTVGEQKEALRIAVKALENQQKVGEWIPVSERLPDKKGLYLVSHGENYSVCIEEFNGIRHFSMIHNYSQPVAWMPLPEPYKGV